MYKFLATASALALCVGVTAAIAQPDTSTQRTTTVVSTPSGTEQTTTTTRTSSNGYTQYRRTVTATKHYDAAAFVAPTGYTYKRFAVGDKVPGVMLGSGVSLPDYQSYALENPPSADLHWIRNGRDALLIDRNTGEVVQTDYDLFN